MEKENWTTTTTLKWKKGELESKCANKGEHLDITSTHKTGVVINLQVFLQPLVLVEEELLAEFEIEIDFSGEGDDVRWPQVPAADTHR